MRRWALIQLMSRALARIQEPTISTAKTVVKRLKSEPSWEHKEVPLEMGLREEAVWGTSLKYLYIPFVARQGNSPAPQIVTDTALSAFGTRFSAPALSCMWGTLCVQLWRGCLGVDSLESSLPKRNCESAAEPGGLGEQKWLVQVPALVEKEGSPFLLRMWLQQGRGQVRADGTAQLSSTCCACWLLLPVSTAMPCPGAGTYLHQLMLLSTDCEVWCDKIGLFFLLIKMLWLHQLISSVSGHHFKWTIQFTLVVYSAKILNHETTFDLMSD